MKIHLKADGNEYISGLIGGLKMITEPYLTKNRKQCSALNHQSYLRFKGVFQLWFKSFFVFYRLFLYFCNKGVFLFEKVKSGVGDETDHYLRTC